MTDSRQLLPTHQGGKVHITATIIAKYPLLSTARKTPFFLGKKEGRKGGWTEAEKMKAKKEEREGRGGCAGGGVGGQRNEEGRKGGKEKKDSK